MAIWLCEGTVTVPEVEGRTCEARLNSDPNSDPGHCVGEA